VNKEASVSPSNEDVSWDEVVEWKLIDGEES
jgi:hypothetical protein